MKLTDDVGIKAIVDTTNASIDRLPLQLGLAQAPSSYAETRLPSALTLFPEATGYIRGSCQTQNDA